MTDDLTTFLLAFSAVWVGIAAYVLYLHKLEIDLGKAVAALEERRAP